MGKKIISIDFDGVLHSYSSGWKGAHIIPDPPVPGAIEWLKAILADDRFEVHIFSSRSHQDGGKRAMARWLIENGLTGSEIVLIFWPDGKPAAHLSIDDRAFCFSGHFPLPDEIDSFRPWFKGGRDRIAELEAELARLRSVLASHGIAVEP